MANSLTLNEYADYIGIETDGLDQGYQIRRSFTSNVAYSDRLYEESAADNPPLSWEDRWVLQGHLYTYWVTENDGSTIVTGPTQARLQQSILFGRGGGLKGAKRSRTFDYDVACPLCGTTCRRNQLRRGYVRPHVTGVNYCPNAFGPENWTYPGLDPSYYDINAGLFFADQGGILDSFYDTPLFCPLIDKEPAYGYPPEYHHHPGVPAFWSPSGLAISLGTTTVSAEFLSLTNVITGTTTDNIFIEAFLFNLPGSAVTQVAFSFDGGGTWQVQNTIQNVDLFWFAVGKAVNSTNWDGVAPSEIQVKLTGTGGYVCFGGVILQNRYHPSLRTVADASNILIPERCDHPGGRLLPDRLSGAGVYTTGGMMDLCPECFSGLRKRVPWG